MLSAHMRGILLYYPTPRRALHDTPAKGGGHSSMSLLEHSLPPVIPAQAGIGLGLLLVI